MIEFYWLDRKESVADDAVIRFEDYAGQPTEQAAKQILDQLGEN